jgi:hypothetical protein
MSHQDPFNQDPVSDPVLPSDAVETDAAPTNNSQTDPAADQPDNATSDDASDTPSGQPPKGTRPLDPARTDKLLKANRKGVGGPSTPAGKARSRLNNLQHGRYAKLPFHLYPWETQEEYDDHAAPLRDQYQPVNQTTADILELFIQASWRLGRCETAEAQASQDPSDIDRHLRRLTAVATLSSSCERSYYRHLNQLEKLLAAFQKNVIETEQAQREEDAKPEKRYTEDGEEIHEGWPKYTIHKLSCIPEDPCNLHLEFIRTVSNKYSVIETPLRDFEGGKYLDPSYKPRGMKGEWPDYLLPQPKKES